jgi:hypothetical protein
MDKKLGRKIARSWGKTTKKLKKIANKGVRKNAKLVLKGE